MNQKELNKKIALLLDDESNVSKKDLVSFYWSKKSSSLLLKILNQFTQAGDLVFDPFLGSAPILYAIDQTDKKIKFVGTEINEMPISFIKFNIEVSINDLLEAKNKLSTFISKYIHLYEYESLNGKGIVSKLIIDREDGLSKIKELHFAENKKKIIFNKKSNLKIFEANEKNYHKRSSDCSKECIDLELIANTRIAIKSGMQLSYIFNSINFFVLSQYSKEFFGDNLMLTLLSSVLHLCRLTDLKSQSQFPFWVPKKDIVERNVLQLIQDNLDYIIKHKSINSIDLTLVNKFKDLDKNNKPIYIINKPIQNITKSDIEDESVDLLITDPPYFDQVAYSEYLKIWEHFCHFKSDLKNEVIFSNRKVDPSNFNDYLESLGKAFNVASNKLRNGSLAIIFFKDSKPLNLHYFINTMENNSLSFIRSVHIGGKKYTYKQNTTPSTTVSGECLFFFVKTDVKKTHKPYMYKNKDEIFSKLENVVSNFVKEYLHLNKNASLGELYDNGLIYELYKNDLLMHIPTSKTIVDILNDNFNKFKSRGYSI
jgi:hypothetical protein